MNVPSSLIPALNYATPVLTITFTQPYVLKSVPQYPLSTGELPASAEATSPTEVELTYTTGGAATDVTIPERDPALRSQTGGYVTPGTFPLA